MSTNRFALPGSFNQQGTQSQQRRTLPNVLVLNNLGVQQIKRGPFKGEPQCSLKTEVTPGAFLIVTGMGTMAKALVNFKRGDVIESMTGIYHYQYLHPVKGMQRPWFQLSSLDDGSQDQPDQHPDLGAPVDPKDA